MDRSELTQVQSQALFKILNMRFGANAAAADVEIMRAGRSVVFEIRWPENHPEFGAQLAWDSRWSVAPNGRFTRTA